MYNIRYVVIALGGPDDPVTDADCEEISRIVTDRLFPLPIQLTVLSERVSNRVTLALLQEKGVL